MLLYRCGSNSILFRTLTLNISFLVHSRSANRPPDLIHVAGPQKYLRNNTFPDVNNNFPRTTVPWNAFTSLSRNHAWSSTAIIFDEGGTFVSHVSNFTAPATTIYGCCFVVLAYDAHFAGKSCTAFLIRSTLTHYCVCMTFSAISAETNRSMREWVNNKYQILNFLWTVFHKTCDEVSIRFCLDYL